LQKANAKIILETAKSYRSKRKIKIKKADPHLSVALIMARVVSGSLRNQISTFNVECVVVYVLFITLYTTPFWTDAQNTPYTFLSLFTTPYAEYTPALAERITNPAVSLK